MGDLRYDKSEINGENTRKTVLIISECMKTNNFCSLIEFVTNNPGCYSQRTKERIESLKLLTNK